MSNKLCTTVENGAIQLSSPENIDNTLNILVKSLKDAPVRSTVRAVHRLLTARDLIHTGGRESDPPGTGEGSWQAYGLELAHALLTACLYPRDVALQFPKGDGAGMPTTTATLAHFPRHTSAPAAPPEDNKSGQKLGEDNSRQYSGLMASSKTAGILEKCMDYDVEQTIKRKKRSSKMGAELNSALNRGQTNRNLDVRSSKISSSPTGSPRKGLRRNRSRSLLKVRTSRRLSRSPGSSPKRSPKNSNSSILPNFSKGVFARTPSKLQPLDEIENKTSTSKLKPLDENEKSTPGSSSTTPAVDSDQIQPSNESSSSPRNFTPRSTRNFTSRGSVTLESIPGGVRTSASSSVEEAGNDRGSWANVLDDLVEEAQTPSKAAAGGGDDEKDENEAVVRQFSDAMRDFRSTSGGKEGNEGSKGSVKRSASSPQDSAVESPVFTDDRGSTDSMFSETPNNSGRKVAMHSMTAQGKSKNAMLRDKKNSINKIAFGSREMRSSMRRVSASALIPEEPAEEEEEEDNEEANAADLENNSLGQVIEYLVNSVRVKSQREHDERETPPVWWKLHPGRDARTYWDMTMFFMLAYTMVALPLRICFAQLPFDFPTAGWFVENVVNGLFFLDMGVNCITGVYVKPEHVDEGDRDKVDAEKEYQNGNMSLNIDSSQFVNEVSRFRSATVLSYKTKIIIHEYLKGWFTVDLVSVLPWDYLLEVALEENAQFASAPRLLKLFRLIRLVKLLRLYRLQGMITQLQKVCPPTIMELLKLSIFVGILAHYVACGFYYVAVLQDEEGKGTWLERYHSDERAVENTTAGSLYLSSMYWGFTTVTSVGYGDITPANNFEKLYAMIVMYCGVVMMSGITGKLTAVLSQFGAQEAQARMQMDSVETYCKYRSLPHHLRKSVTEYFEMRIAAKAVCDEEKILMELSPALKAQVVCHTFRNIVEAMPFFRGCSDLFLSAVLTCMEPIMYAPSDIVIQKGQRELAMYVLAKGRAAVIDEFGRVMKELRNGDFFGELGLFFAVRRTATICSITFSDIFRLDHEQFVKVQAMYPDMRERLQLQAEDMFTNTVVCYLCGKTGHISLQCTVPNFGNEDNSLMNALCGDPSEWDKKHSRNWANIKLPVMMAKIKTQWKSRVKVQPQEATAKYASVWKTRVKNPTSGESGSVDPNKSESTLS